MTPLLKMLRPSTTWRGGVACVACMAALGLLAACSPALDWRDVRLPSSDLTLLFPCKPRSQDRVIELADRTWAATLMVCEAAELTFSALVLSPAKASSAPPQGAASSAGKVVEAAVAPSGPDAALQALVAGAVQRWGASDGPVAAPMGVKLPADLVGTWARHRRGGPDGQVVMTQALFLATGERLMQISVHGKTISDAALENFFGHVRRAP